MRETDKQKIERLERVIDDQKKELSQVKKDRKRLNYVVERLEKEKSKAKETSSSNDIQMIKELKAQIKQLEKTIEEKDLEISKKEERSAMIIWSREDDTKYVQRKYDELCNNIEAEHKIYFENALIELIQKRKGVKERYGNLNAYENGELYYSLTENGLEKEYLIFSPCDLFIKIHPKTGLPLTKENYKVLEKWSFLQYDYQMQMGYWREYLQQSPSEKAKIQSAYNIGKELLPLYEHLLF